MLGPGPAQAMLQRALALGAGAFLGILVLLVHQHSLRDA